MTASIAPSMDRAALAVPSRGSRVEPALISALFVVTAMAAAGYAMFALHPERLGGVPRAAVVYGYALRFFPPAHIVAGVVVLAVILRRRVGPVWGRAAGALYLSSLARELL